MNLPVEQKWCWMAQPAGGSASYATPGLDGGFVQYSFSLVRCSFAPIVFAFFLCPVSRKPEIGICLIHIFRHGLKVTDR